MGKGRAPYGYERLMEELKELVARTLGPHPWRGLTLKSEAHLDVGGKLDGRVFTENPAFGSQSTVMRIHRAEVPNRYIAEIHVEKIPGVNALSMFFPLTESRGTVKELARRTREIVAERTRTQVDVPIDGAVLHNAAYLCGAEGIGGTMLGAIGGLVMAGPGAGEVLGGLIGGALGVVAILALTFRMFD